MYEAFYGLKDSPFSIRPDPEYLYFTRRLTYAYAVMKYGLKTKAGLMVISGEIGCGKTTLIRHLLNNYADEYNFGLVYNTHRETENLLEWIMLAFGLPYEGKSRVALYDTFQRFLIEQYGQGKNVLLIIDEAQNLTPDSLENLRMLSNINADKDQLIRIMLVGQPQLKDMLMRPELLQFAQRVEVDFHIKPLDISEVRDYISHRLAIVGRETPLFTQEACARIAEVSHGIPRRINILCNTALTYGYAAESAYVDLRLIEEVLSDNAEYGALTIGD